MTRRHRSLHRVLWPILALAVATGFVLALWLRPPPDQARAVPRAPMEQAA
jgi:nitrate reductase NapE component